MELYEALILSVVQGITEFLPISSSGHLVIFEHFMGLEVSKLKEFDVLLHAGTLLAIICYFHKDIWKLFKTLFNWKNDEELREIICLIIGTIPAVFMGVIFGDYIDSYFRSELSVYICLLLIGCYFIFAEKKYSKTNNINIGYKIALFIGIAQSFALIPGISRSGMTIATAMTFGIMRPDAARFSFLLGIPAILGAVVWTYLKGELVISGISTQLMITSFIASFIVGLMSIYFMMRFLKSNKLYVFSFYLILISVGLIGFELIGKELL